MVKVRDFQKQDAPAVARLILQLTKNIVEPENLTPRIAKIADDPRLRAIVAEKDGQVVGFTELSPYVIPSKGLVAMVEEVVVDSEARGQGIGRLLMENILELAKELGCRQVKLTAANFVAQKLYESLGFTFKETEVMIKKL